MKKSLTSVLVLMAMGLFLTCGSAQAESYTLQDVSFTNAGSITMEINESGQNVSTAVGPFSVTIEGYDQAFTAFCIDPDQPIGIGNINLEVEMVSANTVAGGLEAAWLLENYANEDKAALQVALWEIIKDDNEAHVYDLTTGNFQVVDADQTVIEHANAYLADLKQNFSAEGLDAQFMASLNPEKQDLMFIGTILNNEPEGHTPEPATMLLLTSGLFGIAGLRRKFKKS